LSEFFPIGILILYAMVVAGVIIGVDFVLGVPRPSPVKSATYECGMEVVGNARQRFHVRYFVVALLFILFDVEVVFLYPWALLFDRMGVAGFVEIMVFVSLLSLGLAYAWRKGALEWN
jgi:NADH-quinone oxidoreductase subunit A